MASSIEVSETAYEGSIKKKKSECTIFCFILLNFTGKMGGREGEENISA